MSGIELLIGASAVVGTAALKKSTEAIFEASGDKGRKLLKSFRNNSAISKLYTQLAKIRKVKTLGQLDKAVDLTTFYCDSHIYIHNKRTKVRSVSDIPGSNNVVIEGIAGQGKSILLRYLTSIETLRGERLPIFAELRKIQENEPFESFVFRTFRSLKMDVDSDALKDLSKTGRIILLLDAFDEIKDDEKERVINEIEDFLSNYEQIRIIITSRPDSGVSVSSCFDVVKLSDLEGSEYQEVIYKISADGELSDSLIKQVEQHKGGIRSLLLTPLLVTLLVIRYKSYQELPDQLSDFYDSLFQVLLQRHDGIKPGYSRKRRCKMNDNEYREAFESFCIITKKMTPREMIEKDVFQSAKLALKDVDIREDEESYVKDIINTTCLLVKDGEGYRFIHKSVQEYYAASYVTNKPEIAAKKIYNKLFYEPGCWHFNQELKFLMEIDSYRYSKYGVIPYLSKLFSRQDGDFKPSPTSADFEAVKERLLTSEVMIDKNRGKYCIRGIRIPAFGALSEQFMNIYHSKVVSLLLGGFKDPEGEHRESTRSITHPLAKVINLMNPSAKKPDLKNVSKKITTTLFEVCRRHIEIVERHEHVRVFDLSVDGDH